MVDELKNAWSNINPVLQRKLNLDDAFHFPLSVPSTDLIHIASVSFLFTASVNIPRAHAARTQCGAYGISFILSPAVDLQRAIVNKQSLNTRDMRIILSTAWQIINSAQYSSYYCNKSYFSTDNKQTSSFYNCYKNVNRIALSTSQHTA